MSRIRQGGLQPSEMGKMGLGDLKKGTLPVVPLSRHPHQYTECALAIVWCCNSCHPNAPLVFFPFAGWQWRLLRRVVILGFGNLFEITGNEKVNC